MSETSPHPWASLDRDELLALLDSCALILAPFGDFDETVILRARWQVAQARLTAAYAEETECVRRYAALVDGSSNPRRLTNKRIAEIEGAYRAVRRATAKTRRLGKATRALWAALYPEFEA